MSLRVRMTVVLLVLGAFSAGVFSWSAYRQAVGRAKDHAYETSGDLLQRTVEMFMVSTRQFQEGFERASSAREKQKVLNDWNRSVRAVDRAVMHDFGPEASRVRLIGDETLADYKPLGGDEVKVEIEFEREALRRFKAGEPSFTVEEPKVLRVAMPLWSDAHPGCGGCHIATVEGVNADLSRKLLLGSVNVYVPLEKQLAEAKSDFAMTMLGLLVGLGVLILAISFYVGRKVIKPIETIALGLDEAAEQVRSGASQVSSASQQLAQGASEQAAAVEETSSSLEELTSVANLNQERSNEARALTEESARALEVSDGFMKDLVKSIQEIEGASQETQKIVKTIDEIAFQTNLLALNAAVEAARAGQAGAGFAVVADEVRTLAQRAAEAARNTAVLIETTVSKIRNGAGLATKTQGHFKDMEASSTKVHEISAEIALASGEQTQGVAQINRAVGEIGRVVQQVAAQAEEAASASEELTAQASMMKDTVASLRMLVTSGNDNVTSKGRRKERA